MLPLAISAACKTVNYASIGAIGSCITDVALWGDQVLAAILITLMFTIMLVKYNFPIITLLPFSSILAFTLWMINLGNDLFMMFFAITLIINGIVLAMAFLGAVNK